MEPIANHATGGRVPLREFESGASIVAGNVGDHSRVSHLFTQYYQCSLAEDFQSRLDEPAYEPNDRLLLQRDGKLFGHVQISRQVGWFGGQRCPLVKLADFLALPEYRMANCEPAMLELAESIAAREGAYLGLLHTDRPEWFQQYGWSCCRGQGFSRANTRAILSHFDFQARQLRRKKLPIEVRSWRHFELDGLRRVYQQVSANRWGMLQRSEATWQWLVGRKAQDHILIAIDTSSERQEDFTTDPNVVGYAVLRDSCIVEMLTLPGYSAARTMLTARACRDAIDRDHHFVSLLTPASDPMHELLVTAGGSWISDSVETGGQWMLKLLAPNHWVKRFYPLLHERAREAGLPRPLELGVVVGTQKYRLMLTRRGTRLESVARAKPDVICNQQTLQDLLTSNLRLSQAVTEGRLQVSDRNVLCTLSTLFPPKFFWQSPFDLLRL